MSSLIKVCDAVQCPFNSNDGCSLYAFSQMCHLAYGQVGQPKQVFVGPNNLRQGFQVEASEHWLYADSTYNCAETEQLQAEFLAEPKLVQLASKVTVRRPYSMEILERNPL